MTDTTALREAAAAARTVATLARTVCYHGRYMPRQEMIDSKIAEGARVVTHPQWGRLLINPDRVFLTEATTTKIGMDYAEAITGTAEYDRDTGWR